jgi:NADH-quinone oxidoreductase subunit J
MSTLFYVSGAIAVISALLVIVQTSAMRALISLIVLLLAIASVFFTLGAPFAAVLQIIIYAGAIIVLFVFAVMILNLGREAEVREQGWLASVLWVLPVFLAGALLLQFVVTLMHRETTHAALVVPPKAVGISLFTDYLIGVELASILLLAALVAAFHYGLLPILSGGENE